MSLILLMWNRSNDMINFFCAFHDKILFPIYHRASLMSVCNQFRAHFIDFQCKMAPKKIYFNIDFN